MKFRFLIGLFILSTVQIGNAEVGEPKPIENLGSAKAQEIQMTEEQAKSAQPSVDENFGQAVENSDAEVQKAIVKAATDLEEELNSAPDKSAE